VTKGGRAQFVSDYDVVLELQIPTCIIDCRDSLTMSRPSLLQRRWMNRATACDDDDVAASDETGEAIATQQQVGCSAPASFVLRRSRPPSVAIIL